MRSSNNHGVRSSTTKYKLKRIWRSTVMVFAAIVVFVTTYAMIIPAITWERTLICPLEAHVHTDFCYNSKGELKCGKEEHRHTDACFDAAPADPKLYFCGQTAHVHDENCYFADGTLKCTLQEHTHTNDCMLGKYVISIPEFLAGSPLADPPAIKHYADPSTKDTIINQFLKNGSFSEDYDGKVVADKTVVWNNDSKQSFTVTLSALGQSYQETVDVRYRMHPDVLFVVDMSSSTWRNPMTGEVKNDPNGTRLYGIQQALNNSIDQLLANDPLTRIGIISFSDTADMDFELEMGYYLRLPSSQNKQYVKAIIDTEHTDATLNNSALYFNSNFKKAKFTGVTLSGDPVLVADTTAANPTGSVNPGESIKCGTGSGTNTQEALKKSEEVFTDLFNGMTDLERSLRVPAMILITDGEPTRYRTEWEGVTGELLSKNTGAVPGYYTALTMAAVKSNLTDLYDDYDNKFRLYTVGPGVESRYGRAVLDLLGESEIVNVNTGEQMTNLEACEGDNYHNYPGDSFYKEMMGITSGYTIYTDALSTAGYDLNYADYADWSLSGALTIQKLNEGMQKIIDEITAIPRPILQSSRTIAPDMIDPESYVEFTDVLGDDMIVDGNPILYYNDTPYTGVKVGSGTVNDASIEKYRGWEFSLYEFTGKVTEPSTNHTIDLSEIRFYVLHDPETGKRVVEWMFPAEHLPIIFHNWKASGSDEFIGVDPIRVAFNVHTQKGAEPGHWYYTNSTEEITTCSFELDTQNPYKNNFNETIQKTDNKTDTDENVAVYSKVGDRVYVQLGNNGKIFCDKYDLYVRKIWADSKNHDSDSVTVKLYKNGSYASKSVTLSKTNDWKGVFEDLPAYDTNDDLIEYTVVEDALSYPYNTYHTTYRTDREFDYHREWTESITTYTYSWTNIWNANGYGTGNQVNTTDTYRFRIRNGNTTTNTTLTNVGLLNPTWNTKVNDDISGAVTKQQWKFVNEGGKWCLRSLYDGRYLGIVSGKVVLTTDADSAAAIDYNELKNYRRLKFGSYYLLDDSGNTVDLIVERLNTNSTTKPTNLEEDLDVRGTEVINSPPVDVTIKKTDEYGNVIAASGVKFGLYYDKECTEKVGTGEYLTDSTGEAIFENLYIGGVYYVKELTAPEGYLKAPDVQKFEVLAEDNIKVETGQTYLSKDGTGKSLFMKMKNIRLYDLPATGGIGIYPIVMIGFCLTAAPLIYALYVLIQRRKRERRQTG